MDNVGCNEGGIIMENLKELITTSIKKQMKKVFESHTGNVREIMIIFVDDIGEIDGYWSALSNKAIKAVLQALEKNIKDNEEEK